ncbi:PAC2 family protein [Angustibacter sp. Root456]|uniref:PAC2 family protein n=1 Tax=Angustibacter sp. Root456 TaxID=1736539 RepID=UPI0006FB9BB5|nr:PAC2 family protein [Angustibacter sp. Root456]KQX68615.1 proteasome protein [Angustibacter sp. Root456]
MLDPRSLYTLSDDADVELDRPVLVHALTGFVDAGSATRLVTDHLLETLEHQVLATFDADQLVDYRSRRPAMVFDRDHYASFEEPRLQLHAVRDLDGRSFLLLTGPEPDTQWERFVAAVTELVERFAVSTTIGLHAIGMPVPHTRPLGVLGHANQAGLVPQSQTWPGTVRIPGSAAALLELRLGESGHPALGFVVQVPHYLAEAAYPDAAAALLDRLADEAALSVPRAALLSAAEQTRETIAAQVAASEEVGQVVAALEEQYDAYMGARERRSLLAAEETLPSADELAAEVEQFLRGESS